MKKMNYGNHVKTTAGGGHKMFSNSLSVKSLNNSRRFFTPIVASSLALFLSAGVAAAADTLSCPNGATGGDPKVCYNYTGTSGTFTDATLNGLTWQASSGDSNVVTPQANSNNIAILVFDFNKVSTGPFVPSGSASPADTYTVVSGSAAEQVIVLDSGGKSIEMAKQVDDTAGKLSVNFGTGADSHREFHLNLSQATGEFSFKGDIAITAGKGDGTSDPMKNSTFFGEFGKNVLGSITISDPTLTNQQLENTNGHRTILNFASGASLIASGEGGVKNALVTEAGITTATFTDGNIEGKIAAHGKHDNALAFNFITFKGEGNKIEGNILASTEQAWSDTIAQNVITFEQGGSIKGNIESVGGTNTITFEGETARIEGDISVAEGGFQYAKENVILMKATGSNTIVGNISATKGRNEITLGEGVGNLAESASITGDITLGTGVTAGANQVTFNAKDSTITGEISAASSTNTIIFRGQDTRATIMGSIKATGGGNDISVNAGTLAMRPKVDDAGAETPSSISTTNGENDIAAKYFDIQVGTISAKGTAGNSADASNLLVATGGGSITATDITAENGTNSIGLGGERIGGLNASVVANGGGINNFILENQGASAASFKAEEDSGKNNIVVRHTAADNTQAPTYTLNVEKGTTAYALQQASVVTKVQYARGVNGGANAASHALIFAAANDGADDSFSPNDTDITNDAKVLGKTYQDGIKLVLQDKDFSGQNTTGFAEQYGDSFVDADGSLATITTKYDATTNTNDISLTGLAVGTISPLDDSTPPAAPYDPAAPTTPELTTSFILAKGGVFAGTMDLGKANLVLQQGGKFLVESDTQTLKNVAFSVERFSGVLSDDALTHPNATIDLGALREDTKKTEFKLLTIGDNTTSGNKGLSGSNGLFRVSVKQDGGATTTHKLGGQAAAQDSDQYGYAYSDRVLVHEGTKGTHYIQAIMEEGTDITKIGYQGGGTDTEGNIAVATIKTSTGITMEGAKQLVGYDVVGTQLDSTATDDKGKANGQGQKDYTTYFIKSMDNQGASKANQLSAITALSNNYMLYLANLNSLNKRMGELRENSASQGAWLRIFNGMQSTNFTEMLDSRAIYTTIQAGYDYTFGFKGASNYLGFALSYANALGSSLSYRDINGIDKGLKNMNSNAFELAIYNAYVQDGASKATGFKNGLYSDSIAKFSYILGSYNFLDQSNKTYDTSNFAFTLSQELGYRFLLGNDKEFYIDPQAEFAFGFFSNSNLAQSMGNNFFLKAMQDSILTLRSRVGSSYGYKFDKFTQNKGFSSSLYLGTYFVSDVLLGGEVSINTNANKPLEIKPLTSDMRFVLNLGTNFKIKDNTRIYFDFERSFGGRITTDYQLNLGVRYSFGTSKYTPYTETTQEAPKDSNTLKEVEPTKGYYIELLEKEDKKLSNKELKTLQNLKEELRIQTKIQNNKTIKTYLAGPFKDEKKAKEAKSKLEGVIKELKGKGSVVEVE